MFYVYCIESSKVPGHTYVGFSEDLKQRVVESAINRAIHSYGINGGGAIRS